MRIHINHLILLEEEFGTFEVGNHLAGITLRFGYWRQIPVENLQSMLRSIMVDSSILVEENLVDEDEECGGELYNYIITRQKSQPTNKGVIS
jgi:hypothetical protein